MYPPGLKELRLDLPARSSYTYKALGAGFWALRQKDFRQAIQAIVLEVTQRSCRLTVSNSFGLL